MGVGVDRDAVEEEVVGAGLDHHQAEHVRFPGDVHAARRHVRRVVGLHGGGHDADALDVVVVRRVRDRLDGGHVRGRRPADRGFSALVGHAVLSTSLPLPRTTSFFSSGHATMSRTTA